MGVGADLVPRPLDLAAAASYAKLCRVRSSGVVLRGTTNCNWVAGVQSLFEPNAWTGLRRVLGLGDGKVYSGFSEAEKQIDVQ